MNLFRHCGFSRRPMLIGVGLFWLGWGWNVSGQETPKSWPWLDGKPRSRDLVGTIAPPAGFSRSSAAPDSFAAWLRDLPLKPAGSPVLLHDGTPKRNQSVHAAVIDIDTGSQDLQQCADAVIRLRAEYLFSRNRIPEICFNFTSGDAAAYSQWRAGFRPAIKGNRVTWAKTAAADSSYNGFRGYLRSVFAYAGSQSLSRELLAVKTPAQMKIGDIFIRGGMPGHAVIIIDMAEKGGTGDKVFLLAQSYMPAQDIHVLKNPGEPRLSPWYSVRFGDSLRTPEWEFQQTELKRFKGE